MTTNENLANKYLPIIMNQITVEDIKRTLLQALDEAVKESKKAGT